MSHYCISDERQQYEAIAATDSDDRLLYKIGQWGEFKRPLTELEPRWRLFCGIIRREAHRRGLEVS